MRNLRRLDRLTALQNMLGYKTSFSPIEQDIDKGIYPLLILMNLSGNKTDASCSGHINRQLRCWKGGDGIHSDSTEGGYVDFTPRSPLTVRNLKYLFQKEKEPFWDNTDVWMNHKRGIGIEEGIYWWGGKINCRISWCLPFHKGQQLIQLLESFFIIEIEHRFRFKENAL